MSAPRAKSSAEVMPDFDALIIGAGFGGIRALYELRQQGLSVKSFEAGSDVGGTWYWNRYPGARTDSEAWAYCYSFSPELLQEWNWRERMPSWDQVSEYLGHVVDRLDLRRHIQFDTRIRSAVYDETRGLWTLTTERGESCTCRFFVSAAGVLSVSCMPPFKGLERFEGQWYVSSRWPKERVSFAGKRVGLVGTGATGVQILPVVAQTAAQVTVFQRTPNYVMPGRNHPLDDAQREGIKANYEALWKLTRSQVFAFPMPPANRLFDDFSPEERERIFDRGWETGGFRYIFETFDDITSNPRANEAAADFIRRKIRTIVKDPKTAELLCPNYPFGAKRPPVGNFYFESFNRDNVALVDISQHPIEEITPKGLRTGGREYEFDIIIFALGFDAVTGALSNIEVRGKDGRTIKEVWKDGPRTQLGVMVDGFPNLFMISGPQTPFANIPVVIDECTQWIGQAIRRVREGGYRSIEATPAAAAAYDRHIQTLLDATVLGAGTDVGSWYMGANIPGKARKVQFYFGGAGAYFQELQQSVASGFEGFALTKA